MNIIKRLIKLFGVKAKKKPLECDYNIMAGVVPGGIYSGITFIPGNPNQKWDIGEEYGICPACEEGKLFYYWQDGDYKLQCNLCEYLHDTGTKLLKCQE